MAEIEFNLLEEPWIRVMKENCEIKEVSLTDALINAHEYKDLAGELPTQNAAILRLLLAVLHAVFERVDVNGDECKIEDSDEAFDRWESLWENEKFPKKPIKKYLESQRENFWLFHPERPFWQVPKMEDGFGTQSEPVKKINGAISESGHKIRLFAERSGEEKDNISYSEAARWLITMNQYDDNTMKTGLGLAFLGKFAAIIAKGNSLFETLMLNYVLLDYRDEVWDLCKASWETDYKYSKETIQMAFPHSQIAIMSFHSRYGKFERVGRKIEHYVSQKGGVCIENITNNEQMATWYRDKNSDEYKLKTVSTYQQLWREFPSIIADEEGLSLLVKWNQKLLGNILKKSSVLKYEVVGLEYDKSNRSSVENIYFDSLSLHLNLLSDLGAVYRNHIAKEISYCGKIAFYIGYLANDIFIASGGNTEKKVDEAAKEQFYYEIDVPFRKWLSQLDANDNEETRNAKIKIWREKSKKIAFALAEKMAQDAGPAAFVGKAVALDKNSDKKKYYSVSMAMQNFNINMKKVYE